MGSEWRQNRKELEGNKYNFYDAFVDKNKSIHIKYSHDRFACFLTVKKERKRQEVPATLKNIISIKSIKPFLLKYPRKKAHSLTLFSFPFSFSGSFVKRNC